MITSDLIRSLSEDAKPVRRLRPPVLRAAGWLGFAAVVLGALTLWHGLNAQFFVRLQDPRYLVGTASAIATGVLAALAAFLVSLPDRSSAWAWLPVPSFALWLLNLGYQCLDGWEPVPPGALTPAAAADCFTTHVITSLPLAVLLVVMLRHAAFFRSGHVVCLGSMAVSALTSVAMTMFHPGDPTAMIIVWNLCAVAIAFAVLGLGARIIRRSAGRR